MAGLTTISTSDDLGYLEDFTVPKQPPTQDELAAALEVLQRLTGSGPVAAVGLTVAQLWGEFCEAVGPERAKKVDQSRWQYIGAYFGAMPAHTVTLRDLDGYRVKRREDITLRGGKTRPATRNREASMLRALFNWAVKRRRLQVNPLQGMEQEPENNVRKTSLDEGQMARLLVHCPPFLKALLIVGFDTGMRRDEIRKLRRDQIDWEAGIIRLYVDNTKTKKARNVHATYRGLKALRDLPNNGEYLFASPATRKPYGTATIHGAFRAAVAAAGLRGVGGEQVTIHDSTRRSFATNAVRRGIPETVVMRMGGWLTNKVFLRYALTSETDIERAVQMLEAHISREVREKRKNPQRSKPPEQAEKPVDKHVPTRRATRK